MTIYPSAVRIGDYVSGGFFPFWVTAIRRTPTGYVFSGSPEGDEFVSDTSVMRLERRPV